MNALDHGQLNVPLSKRGNIDAQLDAYKASQALKDKAEAKTTAASRREQKDRAQIMLRQMAAAPGLLDAQAAKIGLTRAGLIDVLTDWCKWSPSKLIKAHSEWMAS
jgi:hypothetical protein